MNVENPGRSSAADRSDWHQIGIGDDVVPFAVSAFGNPEQARSWIAILDKAPLRPVRGGLEPLWRNVSFLRELADSGLDCLAFQRWRDAGSDASAVPRWAKMFGSRGLGPEHFSRWNTLGLNVGDLPAVLSDLDFSSATDLLTNWGSVSPLSSTGELLEVLRRGLNVEQLRGLLAVGFTGHQVFLWHSRTIPVQEWLPWIAIGVTPEAANDYFSAGFSPDLAAPWISARVPAEDAKEFIELRVDPAQAEDYARRGIAPVLLTRTEDRIEEIDYEELMILEDLEGLPSIVGHGDINFVRHSALAASDYVPYDFSFTWNGGRSASWQMDISITAELSPASSSPSTGTLSWPNGRDLVITHEWIEMDRYEEAVLEGQAPDNLADPRQWIHLADVILGFVLV